MRYGVANATEYWLVVSQYQPQLQYKWYSVGIQAYQQPLTSRKSSCNRTTSARPVQIIYPGNYAAITD